MKMEKNILEIKGLTKTYGDFSLENLCLNLPYGCIMGLIGENGAGKSTTIKAILGLIRPDSGIISVFGKSGEEWLKEAKEQIGIVMGEIQLPATFNGREICRMMEGIYKNWQSDEFYRYLDQFAISSKKKIKDYSRGMKVKAALSIALSHQARLLILDEPTSGLDPLIREEVLEILREFTMDEEHSVLLSSHITSDLEKAADYVAFLHQGRLVLCEDKDQLLGEYRLVKGKKGDIEELQKEGRLKIVGLRENSFGAEGLVKNVTSQAHRRDLFLEPVTLEEIMIYFSKGEKI